ncbi:MAG: hypothetical protein ACE5EO_09975 [Candidatus Krumholzibacteriia bacterium]
MPTRLLTISAACSLLLAAGVISCNVESPDRARRDPLIQGFTPNAHTVDIIVGEELAFSIQARDPDDNALEFYYTVDDSVVATGADFVYVIADTGIVEVRAVVTNGSKETFIRWQVQRMPRVNAPPQVVDFDPTDPLPTVIVGNSIAFSLTAEDPEGETLSYVFTVDDSLVASSNQYLYPSNEVGRVRVRATAFDPDSATATHEWDLQVAAEPDSIVPATVVIQSLVTGSEPGELVVEWIAVGDDSMAGIPSDYLVGTSSTPITDEHTWDAASERTGVPAPASPGAVQTMVIRDLKPADFVWVAVRARDDFGNLSSVSSPVAGTSKGMEVFGTVRDAVTGAPVPGVVVELGGLEATTRIDGGFALTEMPQTIAPFRLKDENLSGSVGGYFDMETDFWLVYHDAYFTFWLMPNLPLQTTQYTSFLDYFRKLTSVGSGLGDKLRTWDFPVDVYVKPFVHAGVDYEMKIKESFDDWELALGMELFTFVDAVPALGVQVDYRSDISADFYEVITVGPGFLPVQGRINMRTVYDGASLGLLKTISMHEIGHAIGMGHSDDAGHLMVGGITATVSGPTQDEVALARAIVHIPRATLMNWYLVE